MRRIFAIGLALAIFALSGLGLDLNAAEPAAGPMTLWKFLGIPQNRQINRDARRNASGDKPNREWTPPTKRLADPANLESPNPAIKAAAEVKADQDLCEQKVKAIKYLASVGCGCYPQVKAALLAALDDCSEEVRYQAAMAFAKAAGDPCNTCGSTCCSAEVMTKLNDMAFGQDAKGCPKEASPRVRAAATKALNGCKMRNPQGPTPAKETEKKELPIEPQPQPAPPEVPAPPAGVTPAPTGTTTAPASGETYIEDRGTESPWRTSATKPRATDTRDLVRPAGFTRFDESQQPAEGAATAEASDATEATPVAFAGRCPCGQPRCSHLRRGMVYVPGVCPVTPQPGGAAPGEARPGEAAPGEAAPGEAPQAAEAAPPVNALAGTVGGAAGPMSAAPNMIGDLLGIGGTIVTQGFMIGPDGSVFVDSRGNVPIAAGDRGFKMSENNCALPVDRVFFDYNNYNRALLDSRNNVRNLDRYTFGVEKTFLNQSCSLEVRVPFANGLTASDSLNPSAGLAGTEFGNIPLVFKGLLLQSDHAALAAGLAVVLPSARDARVFDVSGQEIVRLSNEAPHLGPFLGAAWQNNCWFAQGFAQCDFDARGNDVFMLNPNNAMTRVGTLTDQSLLFLDFSVGRWVYRNPCARWLTGIAPAVELHYTSTMQNADIITGNVVNSQDSLRFTIGNQANRVDMLNLTAGVHFAFGPRSILSISGVAPLRGGDDKQFDGEFQVQYNRLF